MRIEHGNYGASVHGLHPPQKKHIEIFQGANSDHFQRMDSNYKIMSPKKAQSEEGIKLYPHKAITVKRVLILCMETDPYCHWVRTREKHRWGSSGGFMCLSISYHCVSKALHSHRRLSQESLETLEATCSFHPAGRKGQRVNVTCLCNRGHLGEWGSEIRFPKFPHHILLHPFLLLHYPFWMGNEVKGMQDTMLVQQVV